MRESFAWAVTELHLDAAATFLLGLALAPAFDASVRHVIAACLNDSSKTLPTLGLFQKLWDRPQDALLFSDPLHPLFSSGLLRIAGPSEPGQAHLSWDAAITTPLTVAHQLLFPSAPWPRGLEVVESDSGDNRELMETEQLMSMRLRSTKNSTLQIVPLVGSRWSDYRDVVKVISQTAGRTVVEAKSLPTNEGREHLNSIATVCWLRGADLFIPLYADTSRVGACRRILASANFGFDTSDDLSRA